MNKLESNKKRNANMKDVAALAGVSISTISRYLNGRADRMSKETAAKIKIAIDKLNYVPNLAARQMITKSSSMVAVMVANIDDYFSTELFKGASSILESNGYIGMLFDSDSSLAREQQLLKAVDNHMFDGLLLQPLTNDVQTISSEMRRQIPVTLVDRELALSPWPEVVTDNYEAARQATNFFINEGFKHIIILSSTVKNNSTRKERLDGITSITDNYDLIEVPDQSYNHYEVQKKITNLIKKATEKTLIFGLRESLLLEYIAPLMMNGDIDRINVTVTGFSDTRLLRAIDPPLKMLNQNPFLMGAVAAEILINMLTGNKTDQKDKVVIHAKLK